MATEDIAPNKGFLFVPYTLTISPTVARNSEIGHLFESYPYWFSGHSGANDNILWTFLMYERTKGPESSWFPYFETVKAIECLANWRKFELEELQDPVLVFDNSQWIKRMAKVWASLEEVFTENPNYFPSELPLREYFEWAWRVTSTRSFMLEGGMLVPLADNLNHSDCSIRYDSVTKDVLLEEHKEGHTNYSDFNGGTGKQHAPPPTRSSKNRLEKYLAGDNTDKQGLKNIQAIWQLEPFLSDLKSSSDDESVRNYGDVGSDEELDDEEEEEDLKPIEIFNQHYFVMVTGNKTGFRKGAQAYNAYGRLSNRELLIDYGFAIADNKYYAFYFRMWQPTVGRTGVFTVNEILTKTYKEDLGVATLDDVSELFSLKLKYLNIVIFTYFRKTLQLSTVPELQHIEKLPLTASPLNLEVELFIIDKTLDLYRYFQLNYTSTLQYDQEMTSYDLSARRKYALLYRLSQKNILAKQINYLHTLRRILRQVRDGGSINSHLTMHTLKELKETYPMKRYLNSLKANLSNIQ